MNQNVTLISHREDPTATPARSCIRRSVSSTFDPTAAVCSWVGLKEPRRRRKQWCDHCFSLSFWCRRSETSGEHQENMGRMKVFFFEFHRKFTSTRLESTQEKTNETRRRPVLFIRRSRGGDHWPTSVGWSIIHQRETVSV